MRIPKAELKAQRELLELINSKDSFTYEEKERIYTDFNPGMIDNCTENGVFFTPYGLAQDVAYLARASGHVIDVCAGIGMLSFRIKDMDHYEKRIKSMTCIELNPEFVKIGKKLLPEANWICANAFDKTVWDEITKDLPDQRADLMVSNPPFGVEMTKSGLTDWLNYKGSRDLMVLELALRFSKSGYFVMPQGSVPFQYSGRPYYTNEPDRYSSKLKKFIKDNKEFDFNLSCDGIDTSIYKEDWKNIQIIVEAADIQIYPWSLDYKEDSITLKIKEDMKK